jgi:hypothetical protein
VSVTPSIVVRWRIHSGRVLHTGRQRHIHRRLVNISDLQQKSDKLSAQGHDTLKYYKLTEVVIYLGGWSTQLIGVHPVVASHEATVGQVE